MLKIDIMLDVDLIIDDCDINECYHHYCYRGFSQYDKSIVLISIVDFANVLHEYLGALMETLLVYDSFCI